MDFKLQRTQNMHLHLIATVWADRAVKIAVKQPHSQLPQTLSPKTGQNIGLYVCFYLTPSNRM